MSLPKPSNIVPFEAPENTPLERPNYPDFTTNKSGDPVIANTSSNLKALLEFKDIEVKFNQLNLECEAHDLTLAYDINLTLEQLRSYLISAASISNLPKSAIDDHLKALCESNPYHPVKEWLDSDKWDNVKRVHSVIDCLPSNDPELTRSVLTRWLIGCVASLYEDEFKSKLVPVLQGGQSYRKTAFIERIANIFNGVFLEGAELNPDNKDSVLSCIKSWIVELGELERTNRNSQGSLKAFITKAVDTVRPPYARTDIKKKRQTHFIATVNGSDFLKDETGSSRFFVIEMTAPARIDEANKLLGWTYQGGKIKLSNPTLLRQFWLEVKAMYDKGESWMLTDAEQMKSIKQNDRFDDKGAHYKYLFDVYAPISEDNLCMWVTAGEVVNGDRRFNSGQTGVVGKALKRLADEKIIESRQGRSRRTEYYLKRSIDFNLIDS